MRNQPKPSTAKSGGELAPSTLSAIDVLAATRQAIEEARSAINDGIFHERPHGAFSLAEYVDATKVPQETARGQLRRKVVMGDYEQIKVWHVDHGGCLKPILMYRKKGDG